MALLQIAEPGHSPQPHQRRLAVGIDLGTTNSLVAAVRSGLSTPLADAKAFAAESPTGTGSVSVSVAGGGACASWPAGRPHRGQSHSSGISASTEKAGRMT